MWLTAVKQDLPITSPKVYDGEKVTEEVSLRCGVRAQPCLCHAGHCLVGKIPPPPLGWVLRWVGGMAPNFSILGHQATPPPPGGAGALFLVFGFVQGSEMCLNFSYIFHIFFILRQTCEPFVAHHCQTWLVAELVVAFDSNFRDLDFNPWWWQTFAGQSFLRTTANGGF